MSKCSHPKGKWGFNITISFEWKAFQLSARDASFRERILRASSTHASPPKPIAIVLSASPSHHFSKFANHSKNFYRSVSDHFEWPQAWIEDYLQETDRLFDLFRPSALPPNVCVAWMASHIGRRHNGSSPYHHPSAQNGLHHWLNRVTLALAKRRGLVTIDPSEYTLRALPRDFAKNASEGDIYHGYRQQPLALGMVRSLCAGCAMRRGVLQGSAAIKGHD